MPEFILLVGFMQAAEPKRGVSIWVWLIIIVVIVVLLWLLFQPARRTEPKEESRMQSAGPPAPPVESGTASVTMPPAPDDLTIIEGIGPKIAQILNSAGITTFSQLAATDVSRLNEILDQAHLAMSDPGSWPEQARLAAAGDQASLQALQDRLKGGR